MRKNKSINQRFKSLLTKGIALLLVAVMVAPGFVTAVSAIDFGSNGINKEIISAVAKGDLNYLNSNEITAAMRDEILKSFRKDLLKRVEELELTGPVGVILTFSDNSLISTYEYSEKINDMSYEEYKETDEAKALADKLVKNQNKIVDTLLDKELIYDAKHSYVHLLDGVFVNTTYENLKDICNIPGVERVTVSERYLPATAVENPVYVYDTGIFNSSTIEYTGKGTIVAVLDTGCDYSHSAFTSYEINSPLYDRSEIAALLEGTMAYKLSDGLEAREVYYGDLTGNKIAFGYDYADKDPDVMPFENSHGTHVAGIIAGKDDTITGVAIDAQLAIMKVFSDYKTGAEHADIIAALEDSIILGVDAINMSLGVSCGFTYESSADQIYKNELYGKIEKAGISLVVAANNDYSSGFGSEEGNTNKTGNPDSATVGSPSTYGAALSVASISGKKSTYMLANGNDVVFFKPSVNASAKEYDFFDMLGIKAGEKVTYDYVTIPGVGMAINYAGLDVKGKIALVQRGDITFEEKVQFAEEAGAIGILVYNNVYGDIIMTIGNHAKIPAVSIGKDDGEKLAAKESGTLEFNLANVAGPFMSDFSSWGPTPDLKLKPEITAHGGSILSATVGGEYEEQSGTSMASPNMCGITVLIRQYVKEKFPEYTDVQVRDLVNQLCMSTATIALDKQGNPYSPRKQGAGIADIVKATTTPAYLYVDGSGKTKLELGDDPRRTGSYTMTVNLANLSDSAVSYKVGNITMTESVSTSDPEYVAEIAYILSNSTEYFIEGGKLENGVITVEGGKTAKITVSIKLSAADKSYINSTFENGMYVEGFLTFDNTDANGIDLNAPFLAFYGDWGEAPIFDLDYYEVETEAHNNAIDDEDKIKADYYATTPYGTYYYDYVLPLGAYIYDMDETEYTPIPATAEHAAISYSKTGVSGLYAVFAGLLRGAKEMSISIVNTTTGKVVWEKTEYNVAKAHFSGVQYPSITRFMLDSWTVNEDGSYSVLGNNNEKFEVTMSAKLDWEGGENRSDTYSFSFYIDYEAPNVTDAKFRTEYDKSREENRYYLDVMVYDNHYAMSCRPVIVYDIDNYKYTNTRTFSSLTENPIPIYQENRGESTKVTIEITDYIDQIKNSNNPNGISLYIDDYAMNGAICYIPFPETDSTDLEFTNSEITVDINQTADLNTLFVHKDSTTPVVTDYLGTLKWTSSDPSVVSIDGGKIEAHKAGKATIKVTSDSWVDRSKSINGQPIYKTIVVNVTDKVINDDPNAGSNVQIEELKFVSYNTLFAFNSDIDYSSIGVTGSMQYFDDVYNVEFYPSEKIKLNYNLEPWNLPKDRYELTWSSSNPNVATVDENGVVTAEAEGKARITLQISVDGKPSLLAARLSVEVKNEFIIENRILVAYKGKGGDVVIPDDEGIIYIGPFAFCHFDLDNKKEVEKDEDGYYDIDEKKTALTNNTITSVVIPEGVEKIQKFAFANCTKLENVTLPSTCKTLEISAFQNCRALKNVNFDHVKVIFNDAFRNCTSLSCKDLPGGAKLDNLYAVGSYAFANTKLENIKLTSLSRSGEFAFSGCTLLTNVELGERTRVSEGMFSRCTLLKNIVVYGDTIGDEAFSRCTSLESVVLKKDTTYVGEGAFQYCSSLKNVTFEAVVEQIASKAFYGCINLNKITLPNSSVIIGDQVFEESSLKTLVFAKDTVIESLGNNSLKPIGELTIDVSASDHYKKEGNAVYTKDGKTLVFVLSATSFTVPATVTHIAPYAFASCKDLQSISFANNSALESIGEGAFYGCNKLTTVKLPANDVSIGDYAFYGNTSLSNIDLSKVTNIGEYAFYRTAVKSLNLAATGVTVGAHAFEGCTVLATVTLGKNANVGEYAFASSKVNTVTLNDKTEIGAGVFYQCTALASINFANVVGEIGDYAFYGCEKIKNVAIPNVTAIGNYSFGNCYSLETLVAEKVVSIGEYAFASSRENSALATKLKTFELPLLEKIGAYALKGSGNLESVKLPSLKTMGEGAFNNCTSLTSAQLSSELKEIAAYAFYGCENLVFDFTGIERIGEGAFYLVRLPETLVLPDLIYLDDLAFVEQTKHYIVNVTAPKLVHIGVQAFMGCTSLVSVSAPAVEHIGDYAFADTAIVEFEIGSALNEVGKEIFKNNKTLEAFYATVDGNKTESAEFDNVMISGGVLYTKWAKGYTLVCYPAAKGDSEYTVAEGTVRVDFGSASNNDKLEKVIFPRTLEYISDYAFYGCDNLSIVEFRSYYAPTIEGSALGETINITAANKNNYPGFDILYKYSYDYMLRGKVEYPVYYRNFKGDVGSAAATGMTMIRPENCEGYDSLIYNAFFTVSEQTSATTTGKYAVAFIQAVFKLPENVDRFDQLLVEAAINAYNALMRHTEELEFVDDSYVEKFLKVRSAYNVDVVESLINHLFDMDATKYSFEKVKEAHTAYNALTAEEKALITGADTLQTKISELSAAIGRDVDFSLAYEDHFPKEDTDGSGPSDDTNGEPNGGFPITFVIACVAAVVVLAGGAVITVLLIRKKKSAQ